MLASSSSSNVVTSVEESSFWVFGYSSLCWKPGFTYSKCCVGYVKGYSRKFWQGSISHRGTEAQPGRVATLIEDDKSIVWGCAFKVTSDPTALGYLETRECSNGGYLPATVKFYPIDLSDNDEQPVQAVEALTFIARANNPMWLGDAPLTDICSEIIESKGIAGHNIEYLIRLTNYLREHIPQETDAELFELESLVMNRIRDRNMCLSGLLNASLVNGLERDESEKSTERRTQTSYQNSTTSKPEKSVNDDFTHRVPDKKLRCVNI